MKIILAQPRGFCAGVVRAIDIVERALRRFGSPVYVHHEIVHNGYVVEDLQRKGAIFVDDLSDVPEAAVAIFSAHGVSRQVELVAQQRNLHVLDATCPLVSKVHMQGQRYAAAARTVLLIGHAGHPEVVGTIGQIVGSVVLVQDSIEAEQLDIPADTPLAYITQTTLSVDDTQQIIHVLQRRFTNLIGPPSGDVCYATQNRQSAVRELCRMADLILVVGSSNSSNSRRLQEIAASTGRPSFLIDDGKDLRAEWLFGVDTIGLTAGASAPDAAINHVIETVRLLAPVQVTFMNGPSEKAEFTLPPELRGDL